MSQSYFIVFGRSGVMAWLFTTSNDVMLRYHYYNWATSFIDVV